MKQLRIGDITIDAVIEREGPWRRPQDFFPAYDDAVFKHHLPTMEPEVFDAALGMMVITYQTFVVRTPRYTILVDTCTGEDKGHPPPFDFPGKERWRNELFALGISLREGRLCVLHPSSHRPYRLEHHVARRPLGADVPECEIRLSQTRIRGLGSGERQRRQSARHGIPRQLPADRRSRPGAAGRRRLRAGRYRDADADAGAFALPLLRQHLLQGASARWWPAI